MLWNCIETPWKPATTLKYNSTFLLSQAQSFLGCFVHCCLCVSFALMSSDVSSSQTQQSHASQAFEQRERLSSPSKKKWKSPLRKSPCIHMSPLLRWLHPREDRKSLLASMDPVPSNYGSLLWKPWKPWGGSSSCLLAKMFNGHTISTVL